jgi:hypothetical protein
MKKYFKIVGFSSLASFRILLVSIILIAMVLTVVQVSPVSASVATITVQSPSTVTSTYIVARGNITNTGGETPTVRGFCYNTSGTPTVLDTHSTENGTFTTGAFTAWIQNLTPKTLYYIKSYVTNPSGTSYSDEITFTTGGGVWRSVTLTGNVNSLAYSGGYLYGAIKGTYPNVVQITPGDMLLVDTWVDSSDEGELPTDVMVFDGYIYVIIENLAGFSKVYKIDPSNMETVGSPWIGGVGETKGWALANDGVNIYAASWVGSGGGQVSKISKIDISDMTTISTWTGSAGETSIWRMHYQAGYLYAACETVPGTVLKIDVSTMTTSDVWVSVYDFSHDMAFDTNYLYVGSENNRRINQVTLATMETHASSATGVFGTGSYSMTILDGFVYAGFLNGGDAIKIDTSDMSTDAYWDNADTQFSTPHSLTNDGTYIYIGGVQVSVGVAQIVRIDPTNMTTEMVDFGLTKPGNVSATTDNATESTIIWDDVAGADNYSVYRDGTLLADLIGDVNIYHDTTVDAPTITAGTAAATDGSSTTEVTLSLTGASANHGTSYSYTVRAFSNTSSSAPSSSATGYTHPGTLSIAWKRGADGVTFGTTLAGGTTNPFDDTTGVAGTVYHYRAALTATGATAANSASDTGYLAEADQETPAIITTSSATDIQTTSATSGGEITATGSSTVTERGIVYALTANPDTAVPGKLFNTGTFSTGLYSKGMTELTPNTTYHVRAYAINSFGTSYGADQAFTTQALSSTYAPIDEFYGARQLILALPMLLLLGLIIMFGFIGLKQAPQGGKVVITILIITLSFILIGVCLVVGMPIILGGAESTIWFK